MFSRPGDELLAFTADMVVLKHESKILGHSFNTVCGFSTMEQVRLCTVLPMDNWLDSSLNRIQGWTTVLESYSRALEQGPLLHGHAVQATIFAAGARKENPWLRNYNEGWMDGGWREQSRKGAIH